MSPLVTLPHPDFAPDTEANADQVDANFGAVVSVLNGGLDDDNIAGPVSGTKLSTEAGKRTPNGALETNSVDSRVLASHATTAQRAVTALHIQDGAVLEAALANLAVTAAKLAVGAALANLVAATVGLDKLKVTVQTKAFSFAVVQGVTTSADVTPDTAIPTATSELVGLYFTTLTAASDVFPPALERRTSGANYIARVWGSGQDASGTCAGSVTFVSIVRTS